MSIPTPLLLAVVLAPFVALVGAWIEGWWRWRGGRLENRILMALDALPDGTRPELTAGQIAVAVERAEGRLLGLGTLLGALDRLVGWGLVERRREGGPTRWLYRARPWWEHLSEPEGR